MKKQLFTIIIFNMMFGIGQLAWGVAAPVKACADDVQRFCAGLQGRAIRHCLYENSSQLSPACQQEQVQMHARHQKMRAEFKALKADCAADIQQFCANDAVGPARFKCLMSNQSQLSPACQKDLSQLPKWHQHDVAPAN